MSEAAANLLPERFRHIPCEFIRFNAQSLASDVVSRLATDPPLGLVLLHLDSSDFPRVLATLRRVRRGLPDLSVVVARWGEHGLSTEERTHLISLGAQVMVTTPAELASWLSPRALDVAGVVTS